MVSRETFIKQVKEMLASYHKTYSDRNSANRFFLHDKSNWIRATTTTSYSESPGSSQQMVRHNDKVIYNSDMQKLTDALLMKIMLRTVNYKELTIKKPQWVLRLLDTRVPQGYEDYPYSYWFRKTRAEAERIAKGMRELPFIKEVDLMKERSVDQYIMTGRRDYELIDHLIKKRN